MSVKYAVISQPCTVAHGSRADAPLTGAGDLHVRRMGHDARMHPGASSRSCFRSRHHVRDQLTQIIG